MSESQPKEKGPEEGRIFIIRHAQSAANAGGRTADPATIPITDVGNRQARCLTDLISDQPRTIVVSRYVRTAQTAEPLSKRYPGAPIERWRVEEFTYLDTTACTGTTYAERKDLRDAYWKRCDALWVDGAGCECFADFIQRMRRLEQTLSLRPDQTVVVFTHGFVMRALLWLPCHTAERITDAEMAAFDGFRRRV